MRTRRALPDPAPRLRPSCAPGAERASDAPAALLECALRAGGARTWHWDLRADAVVCEARSVGARGGAPTPSTLEAWLDGVHPADRAKVETTLAAAAISSGAFSLGFRLVDADGTHPVEAYGRSLQLHGRTTDVVAALVDRAPNGPDGPVAATQRGASPPATAGPEDPAALVASIDAQQRVCSTSRGRRGAAGGATCTGRPVRDVVGSVAYAQLRRHIERALQGHSVSFEEWIDGVEPGRRRIRARFVPQFDAAGAVRGFVATLVDVTRQHESATALAACEMRFRLAEERNARVRRASWDATP